MAATTGLEADYAIVTERAGLLDRSERGKLALTGKDAKEFLHGQVTQDINGIGPGHGRYAAFLTQKGKMLGDLRVLDASAPTPPTPELLLDTERVALQPLFNMIRRYSVGYDVELHKRTLESGLLSLLGPGTDAVLSDAFPSGTLTDTEHDHLAGQIGRTPVRVIRSDVGVDVLMAAEDKDAVRVALLEAGAVEVAEQAADCLRIEHGRPRYGVDLDDSVIPQEAGLNARAVSFTKGCYVGQETVARLFYKGKPNRELRGLTSAELLPAGTELMLEERVVGTVTSSIVSPRYGAIALALVRREAPAGAFVSTADGHEAVVAELPFN
ncbi:MAG TPA: glycine cleavage T C-terminal barrel domain-containing protein [Solirubrobacteraceae bacterium]|jgi:folate-binding protein YgfZ|nr:glycine cleavage T C-terminal barrel domain-containing protein [Solirubrobacteraceae bacterium]